MLSILCVILTIKVKVGIPESFKVGWYPLKKTGSSHLKAREYIKAAREKRASSRALVSPFSLSIIGTLH